MGTASSGTVTSVAPEWLIVSGMTPQAMALYNMMHTLRDARGIAQVRVSDLAELLGYSRGDKIIRYVREVEKFGAIEPLRRAGGRYPGFWLVREDPPESYHGPRTLVEWYELRRKEAAA